jgi:nucleoside-diphosphate-sugar epimerase
LELAAALVDLDRVSGTVLITGTTGFVGMEVLARYLERGQRRIALLVRAPSNSAARKRVDEVLGNLFGERGERYAGRIDAIAADLTAPDLGLGKRRRDQLAEETTTIVHSAASVAFTLPLEEARAVNLEGTRRMLEFAELARERGGLERYGQVSTAYVAGTHSGRFAESDLDVGQQFNNSYEQSKFEAERLVRSHPELPYCVLRPSIVVGDRRSGWTSAFNVLYWPRVVPGIPSAPVDVVSVDYVADAIHELCESGGEGGETYHLTAGRDASTMLEIALVASRYFKRPLPKLLPPDEFAALEGSARSTLDGSRAYFPYFSVGAVFDESAARARLEAAGISVTPLRDYLERLLDFATRSGWGKRPIGRAQALLA